jgi:hypothetical protein
MNWCIRLELEYIEECWQGARRYWQSHGSVDIVLAADRLPRPLFDGSSAKVEIGDPKMLPPMGGPRTQSASNTQQAACPAVPLFMHDRYERYSSLKATLSQVFVKHHLSVNDSARAANGEEF